MKKSNVLKLLMAGSLSLSALTIMGCPPPDAAEPIIKEVQGSPSPSPVAPVESPSADPSTTPSADPSTTPSTTPSADPTGNDVPTDTTEPSDLFKAQVSGKTFVSTGSNGEKLEMKFNGPGNMVTFTANTSNESNINKITVMAGGDKVAVFNKSANGFKVQALQTITIFVNQNIADLLSKNPVTLILEPGGEIDFDNKELRSATGNPIVSPTPSPSSGGSSSGGGSVISGPSGNAG